MKDFSQRIANLSPEKLKLLVKRLEKKGGQVSQAQTIPRRSDPSLFPPLSFAQERLWFLDHLEPGSPLYNLSDALHIEGTVNVAMLEQIFSEVVRRHEVLRTSFAMVERHPVQVIDKAATAAISVVDLSDFSDTEQETICKRLAIEQAYYPFDLAKGPLLRTILLRLSEGKHMLLLAMHHIISDGWSLKVFIRETIALYEVCSAGNPSPLFELPIQYADFVEWQREQTSDEALETELAYWRQQLSDAPAVLQLPVDRPRPAVQVFRGEFQSIKLTPSMSRALRTLSEKEGVTLFMTLLTVFQTLLYRYTAQDDLLVGSPIAGRNRIETEDMIGLFINTLVFRTNMGGNPSFRELLGRVREMTLEAYSHPNLPFDKLVETLQPERNLSYTPLFQVWFGLDDSPMSSLKLPGLTVNSLEANSETMKGMAKFDLTMSIINTVENLHAILGYNTDLFDPTTINRILKHFQNLIESIVADLGQRISMLAMLTLDEQQKLLVEWNRPWSESTLIICLHQLFEEQVERTPDAVAVLFEEQQLTYGALNRRANQLAHYLRTLGVGTEVLVGMCIERSVVMVVGLLGILKAGGGYVPLDPAYPKERLDFMLADAQVPVLLTQQHLIEGLPRSEASVICLDTGWEVIAQESQDNPISATNPENLAYGIYTSGSTGEPKGVLVSHYNVVRLFKATQEWFRFDENDVWTFFHSYAFDFSVWEFWGTFLYGGRLVIVPYGVSRSPEDFYALLCNERVTVLNQTPSAFHQLIHVEASLHTAMTLYLRLVIFGGEALDFNTLKPWFNHHGDLLPRLVNMYGITETTVHVTYHPLREEDLSVVSGSVIGRPIPDMQVYILDTYQQPVPIGVPGELYIGGAGLAQGYLNQSGLTAKKFIPTPFNEGPGARLYRTGDLARFQPCGNIEFLGRIDAQVNLRGHRIEPGEIEAALCQHPAVQQAVVLVREDTVADKRLVAYLVTNQGPTPNTDNLRRFVMEKLPDYMVPQAFVRLDALPLTPSGKIDHLALPAPSTGRPESVYAYMPPRTVVEKTLAKIWSEALGIEQVGIHDNFFALGGDSIRSIRVVGMAKKRGLNFSVKQLFQRQTIYEIAQELNMNKMSWVPTLRTTPFSLISEADRLKIPDDVEDAYPLTMLQAGMLYHMDLTPNSPPYHNINSWHLQTRWEPKAFQDAVQQIVTRYVVLRTSFNLTNYSEPLQLVHKTAFLPVTVDDLRQLSFGEQEEIINSFWETECRQLFDLSLPPLLRFHIHRRTEDTFQFTLVLCHSILDGWSLTSILAEIFNFYSARLENKPFPDEPLPALSYRDFVQSERMALKSKEYQQYWTQKLNDYLPTPLPRWPSATRRIMSPRIRRHELDITAKVAEGLNQLAQSANASLKSVLFAAHVKVLSLITGQTDILTGLSAHCRPEEADGDRLYGLFLNIVPFRVKLSEGTWTDLVREIFESEVEILPFRFYPLAVLQNDLGNQRLFETLFSFVHYHSVEGILRNIVATLSATDWSETNFTLMAAFHLQPVSSELNLELHWDTTELCEDQIVAMGNCYLRILSAMASDPLGYHTSLNVLEMLSAPEKILLETETVIEELDENFSF